MKIIKPDEWVPVDGKQLEAIALVVAKSAEGNLVLAGPGAGKTELLAQRACFLLQTNTCRHPQRILAISFKKDAAYNLKERVKDRCGEELALRFDSLTFDAFAKQILDRFKKALPTDYKIAGDYKVLFSDNSILNYYRVEAVNFANTTENKKILAFHNGQLPLPENNPLEVTRKKIWKTLISRSELSFQMIMRLAELIINSNPRIKSYLQQTYGYVFLDEFQDTTDIQYEFFKSCFLGSGSVFTAVGDDKQRIMVWAGARQTVFEDFVKDTGAKELPLKMNFRSAPRIVQLLNFLTEHLLKKNENAVAAPHWDPSAGECHLWVFSDQHAEMKYLLEQIKKWIHTDGVKPRDICILVKQQLGLYADGLIAYFKSNGVNARDESKLQDLLSLDLCHFVLNTLYSIFAPKTALNKREAIVYLSNLHNEYEDIQMLKLEIRFAKFIKKWQKEIRTKKNIEEKDVRDLVEDLIKFAGKARITSQTHALNNLNSLQEFSEELKDQIITHFSTTSGDMVRALDMLRGIDTIPVMTIHKSKGLEYHSVVFVGLEDGAFWSFATQPDEDKCSFFVALSRAKERVVFSICKQRTLRNGPRAQSVVAIKEIIDVLQKSKLVVTLAPETIKQ